MTYSCDDLQSLLVDRSTLELKRNCTHKMTLYLFSVRRESYSFRLMGYDLRGNDVFSFIQIKMVDGGSG